MNWSKLPTFVSVTMVVGLVVCVVACSGTTTSSVSGNGQSVSGNSQDTSEQRPPTEYKIDAAVEAQKCVKRFLKYPLDAQFPWFTGSTSGNDDDGYWVTGQVKAKNAFGAELTHEWKVNLTVQNGAWHLVYCQIGNEVAYVDEDIIKALETVATTPEIEEKPKPAPKAKPAPEYRTWTDDTGGYTVEAEFAGYIAGTVKLRKRDGKEVTMPMERLSEEDQAWIRGRGK